MSNTIEFFWNNIIWLDACDFGYDLTLRYAAAQKVYSKRFHNHKVIQILNDSQIQIFFKILKILLPTLNVAKTLSNQSFLQPLYPSIEIQSALTFIWKFSIIFLQTLLQVPITRNSESKFIIWDISIEGSNKEQIR